ncbi:hypothetical protein LZ30DRAFT_628457 [Colletotrichum cereale]|nr:hypothetical protein LZ30DRAFT_628457 [Colletotrichum cereale]
MPRRRRNVLSQQFPGTKERFEYMNAELPTFPGQNLPNWHVKVTVEDSYGQILWHLRSTSLGRVSKYWLEWLSHFHAWNTIMGYVPLDDRKPFPWAKFVPSHTPRDPEENDMELIRSRQAYRREIAQTADRPVPNGYDETVILMEDEYPRRDEPRLLSDKRRREIWRAVFPRIPCQDRPFEIRVPNLHNPLEFSHDLDETNKLIGPTVKAEMVDGQDPQGRRVLVIAFGFASASLGSDTSVGLEEIATAYKVTFTWARETALSGRYSPLHETFGRFIASKAQSATLSTSLSGVPLSFNNAGQIDLDETLFGHMDKELALGPRFNQERYSIDRLTKWLNMNRTSLSAIEKACFLVVRCSEPE